MSNLNGNQHSRYGAIARELPFTMGKVFFVVNPADTDWYATMQEEFPADRDGYPRVFNSIQSALDATVTNRNDYVLVMPSSTDYDLTAALTMTKNRVHLVCLPGIGNMGMNNFARIHQNTATTQNIVVTGDCVEIAGLFFKGYDGTAHDAPSIIHLSGTRWTAHIHDNFFGVGATAAGTGYGILADGACSHFNIHHNYFTNYAPGAMTGTDNALSAFIGITSASSTRGLICDNVIHTGANTTVASGITNAGYGMVIARNYLFEDTAFGSSEAGVFTKGITGSVDTFMVDNRMAVATAANSITGGTADHSCVENWEAENGSTIIETV